MPYAKGFRHGTALQYSLGRKIHSITYREGISHGPEIFYYPNGRVQYRVENRYGELHGTLKSYHPNGLIQCTGGFRDGEMHGERILRDSTGALYNGEYLTTFPMNMGQYRVTCTQGRPHGELIMQRDDGSVSYTGQYVNGRPDGEFLYFDREGEVYRKAHYENGVFQRAQDEEVMEAAPLSLTKHRFQKSGRFATSEPPHHPVWRATEQQTTNASNVEDQRSEARRGTGRR